MPADPPETDLPPRFAAPARRALIAAGLTRLEQIAATPQADLLRLHGMGPKALRLLREALAERGLSLAGEARPSSQSTENA